MKFEHISFPEAVKKIAQKYGIELPRREYTPRQKQIAGAKERLFALNELAATYFSNPTSPCPVAPATTSGSWPFSSLKLD